MWQNPCAVWRRRKIVGMRRVLEQLSDTDGGYENHDWVEEGKHVFISIQCYLIRKKY